MIFTHQQGRRTTVRAAEALALASAIAFGLAGCAPPAGADPTEEIGVTGRDSAGAGALPGATAPPSPPPPQSMIDEVCPGDRRVGKMNAPGPGGDCPPPGAGWTVQKVFSGGAAPLSLYCRYDWTGSTTPDPLLIPDEDDRAGKVWTKPDCMAVTTMAAADDAEAAVKSSLRSAFRGAVERPMSLPTPPSNAAVRVAVIDSWPSGGALGVSRHGIGMAGVIDDLTCDLLAGQCPVQIAPYLALNMVEPGVVHNNLGGYFGYQSRLARQIENAVNDWLAETPASKLILNLSIGWDPPYQDDDVGAPRPSASAVREAIEYATCKGALVIAAAGNTAFGPDPTTGLIYPAAWGGETGACPGAPRLVWPVGGLDARDRPLYNSRMGGMPKLAAPGELAYGVLHVPGSGNVVSGPFSGNSVSTAVATAAAAAVWMYDSGRPATDVMNLVLNSGQTLSFPTDAGLPGMTGPVKRISLWRTMSALGLTLGCDPPPHGDGAGTPAVWTPGELATVESLVAVTFPGPALINPLEKAVCSLPTFRLSTAFVPGLNACPVEQYPGNVGAPTTGPQPGSDPCGACALAVTSPSEATLEIAVSSEMLDPVFAQVLTLYSERVAVARYDVGSLRYTDPTTGATSTVRDGLLPGEVYKLDLTGLLGDAKLPAVYDTAILEWVNSPDIQTASRVVVFDR